MIKRSVLASIATAIILASAALPAPALGRFILTVDGRGNPAVKVEVSAMGFRQVHDLAPNGSTGFVIAGSPRAISYMIEGCGTRRGGSYAVNGTSTARLEVRPDCRGIIVVARATR